MTAPCRLGLKCIHMVYDEEGTPCCVHPWTLGTITQERFDKEAVPCDDMTSMECRLVEKGSDLEYLLSMSDLYNPEEWKSLMSRLSVHLDRPYEDSALRHRRVMQAAQDAWVSLRDGE